MKKDAIIDLLENDLREIHTLVETFREPERIASAFLDLLRQKHDSLGKEIALLDYWATEAIDNSQLTIDNYAGRPDARREERNARDEGRDDMGEAEQKTEEIGNSQLTIGNRAGRPDAYVEVRKAHAESVGKGENGTREAEQKTEAFGNSQLTIDNRAGRPDTYCEDRNACDESRDDTREVEQKTSRVMSVLDEIAMLPDEMPLPAPEPREAPPAAREQRAKQVAPPEKTDKQPSERQTPPARPTPPRPETRPPAQAAQTATNAPKAADIVNYGTPVDDIRKALSINDRILFQRELFGGNKLAYDAAVETVNAAASYAQAHEYFRQTYHWDENDPATEAFFKAVHRRFL